MTNKNKIQKIIVSGGGTGGHIFPAVSIANEFKKRYPDCDILFVGAENKMEMEKVPAEGYKIIGLPVAGFHRRVTAKNLLFFPKLIMSLLKARKVIREFEPDIVIGTGGFASGPILQAANRKGIPTYLQEQNSFAGVTNKILAKKASKIFVAYDNMDKFFPSAKIVKTGNPVRHDIRKDNSLLQQANEIFGLDPNKKTILVVGGSLGARTLNDSIENRWEQLVQSGYNIIWQTGKLYIDDIKTRFANRHTPNIKIMPFIPNMNLAYTAADLVISRAGAGTLSELCVVGLPSILVPSPNVAEDHQTHNAKALELKEAALLIKDSESIENLVDRTLEIIKQEEELTKMASNSKRMGLPNAVSDIVDHIIG